MSNTIRNGNEVKGNPISTHFHVKFRRIFIW